MSADTLHPKPSLMTFGIIGLVVAVIAAYVASVAMYASSGVGDRHEADVSPASDQTSVTLNLEDIQSNYSVLSANLIFSPDLTFWIHKPTISSKTSVYESDPRLHRPAGRM